MNRRPHRALLEHWRQRLLLTVQARNDLSRDIAEQHRAHVEAGGFKGTSGDGVAAYAIIAEHGMPGELQPTSARCRLICATGWRMREGC